MTTPVKEYSLNVLATPDTQRARPTVLVCVPVHHGPYDLVVRVRTGRYDSRDHRVRSRDLPLAVHDPPPASEWSEDGMTITMYPFKAWDGPVTEDPSTVTAASRPTPDRSGGEGRPPTDGTPDVNNGRDDTREVGRVKNEAADECAMSSLASDDMDMVPGTPGEDDEVEETWMMKSYRKSVARMAQEVVLR
ncbi:hypothetical protein NLI96_g2328 [Meripilus lineatus]|uniref:Uncharacterized protein n=1 Tax=Meripilus lineatus TaxID=2056292 RepID=A0AAD5V8K8_9APHY|nr:hypothetical protein NLI96_g2328 [Physisporinus lineatus]